MTAISPLQSIHKKGTFDPRSEREAKKWASWNKDSEQAAKDLKGKESEKMKKMTWKIVFKMEN